MAIIDTHAHLYLSEFENDLSEVMERALAAGVNKIILPAIDSSTHQKMLALEKKYTSCYSMIGLHPCSVNQDYKNELDIVSEYLSKEKFIAIGEIGLDFYWDKTYVIQQYEAFNAQIEFALSHQMPIAVHSRNATDECIEVINQFPDLKGVFHCFSGNVNQANKITECGFYLGIGGVVSFKNSGLDKVIEQVGLTHIVLETDAPYLAPVPYRGKRNEPSYINLMIEKLSSICAIPRESVEELTTANAIKLFKL